MVTVIIFIFPTDVSIAVIDLLQEMTDVDTLNESEEGATALIDALVSTLHMCHHQKARAILANYCG